MKKEVPLDQNLTPMVLGERLNNPYALEVMQAAAESLTPAGKPVPTLTNSRLKLI